MEVDKIQANVFSNTNQSHIIQTSNSNTQFTSSISSSNSCACISNCWTTMIDCLKRGWEWIVALITTSCSAKENEERTSKPKILSSFELFIQNPQKALESFKKDPNAFITNYVEFFVQHTEEFCILNKINPNKKQSNTELDHLRSFFYVSGDKIIESGVLEVGALCLLTSDFGNKLTIKAGELNAKLSKDHQKIEHAQVIYKKVDRLYFDISDEIKSSNPQIDPDELAMQICKQFPDRWAQLKLKK